MELIGYSQLDHASYQHERGGSYALLPLHDPVLLQLGTLELLSLLVQREYDSLCDYLRPSPQSPALIALHRPQLTLKFGCYLLAAELILRREGGIDLFCYTPLIFLCHSSLVHQEPAQQPSSAHYAV